MYIAGEFKLRKQTAYPSQMLFYHSSCESTSCACHPVHPHASMSYLKYFLFVAPYQEWLLALFGATLHTREEKKMGKKPARISAMQHWMALCLTRIMCEVGTPKWPTSRIVARVLTPASHPHSLLQEYQFLYLQLPRVTCSFI